MGGYSGQKGNDRERPSGLPSDGRRSQTGPACSRRFSLHGLVLETWSTVFSIIRNANTILQAGASNQPTTSPGSGCRQERSVSQDGVIAVTIPPSIPYVLYLLGVWDLSLVVTLRSATMAPFLIRDSHATPRDFRPTWHVGSAGPPIPDRLGAGAQTRLQVLCNYSTA
ncbi:hypothetical protein CIHG_08992 [Coccidioides immitis H538.4]|uniref:Uncharacterized protein n=1 Tax=Coccidioides immitis H538.4 TaxID=396776 RepID=A0A0J8S1I1_COCIT|nr:hypothetical protein CIHG_08992 [Coccidioides immitis H538.4]